MSSWIYRKPEPTHERGVCILCMKNLQKRTSRGYFQSLCSSCDNKRFGIKQKKKVRPYRKYKLPACELCGFKAVDACQLDVHHLDGNHHNNDPNNLKTLCSNCHRLEHKYTPEEAV